MKHSLITKNKHLIETWKVLAPQAGPGNSGGTWDTNTFDPTPLQRDPLSRLNLVFTGNTGNGIDVQNAAFFSNNEPQWKSRSSNGNVANPPGPFGNTARNRSVTNLRGGFDTSTGIDTAAPFFVFGNAGASQGFQFSYEAFGPTTWQVETGFDRSGSNSSSPFYNPNAGAGGSQNNFDDFSPAIIGTPTRLWSVVAAGAFTFPNVASPSLLTADITVAADPSSTPISQIRTTFSEYVTGVDINDFQLLNHSIETSLTTSVATNSPSFNVSNGSVFSALATPFDVRVEGETLRVTSVVGNTLNFLNPTTAAHNASVNSPIKVTYIVPLVDALSAPLNVVPDASTLDPNNPSAYKSYTIDISFPTATAGNYELRVLTTDVVTPVRDVLPQPVPNVAIAGQGNSLTPVIDNDGVLQNYASFLNFTVDNVQPVATIGTITPDPPSY